MTFIDSGYFTLPEGRFAGSKGGLPAFIIKFKGKDVKIKTCRRTTNRFQALPSAADTGLLLNILPLSI